MKKGKLQNKRIQFQLQRGFMAGRCRKILFSWLKSFQYPVSSCLHHLLVPRILTITQHLSRAQSVPLSHHDSKLKANTIGLVLLYLHFCPNTGYKDILCSISKDRHQIKSISLGSYSSSAPANGALGKSFTYLDLGFSICKMGGHILSLVPYYFTPQNSFSYFSCSDLKL